jgi:hypothetical protein
MQRIGIVSHHDATWLFGGEMMDTDSLRESKPECCRPCTTTALIMRKRKKMNEGDCKGLTLNVA